VIVAVPTAAARAAKQATSTVPIVMSGVADPIGEGLIASFARPGGNVTGVTISFSWAVYGKQLQLLKDAIPSARRIAWLRDPSNPASVPGVGALTDAARTLGIELQVVGARTSDEFEPAFQGPRHPAIAARPRRSGHRVDRTMSQLIAILLTLGQSQIAVETSSGYVVRAYPDTETGVTYRVIG
jgi:hypothetical protein